MTLQSQAFQPGGQIPVQYTCDGQNVSPPLSWSGAPPETKAFVLLLTDPDAGKTFDHWVIYDIQPGVSGFAEAQSGTDELHGEAIEGKNGFGDAGYGGPCPPRGSEHGYVFDVYALREPTGLSGGASSKEVQQAMLGKVLARGELIGRFGR